MSVTPTRERNVTTTTFVTDIHTHEQIYYGNETNVTYVTSHCIIEVEIYS